jgi:exodeoxyribonuclease-3
MLIATWNVNSIRSRLTHVINWLECNPVDVLCLQETKVIDTYFPKTLFEELGYHLYISGQKAYNGVALISRSPLKDISMGFAPILGEIKGEKFDVQKRVITAVINQVRIINLYVPNGSEVGSEKYEFKLLWLELLKDYLTAIRDQTSQELCVCGDFNIALEDQDIYDPRGKENHILSTPAERQALQNVLSIGLKDAFRKFTTEGNHFSWWDYRSAGFIKNRGWRIDHIYLTPKLYEQAISCKIDIEPRKQEKPSDHTPVIVEF